jgi:GTP-binding protein HflX
VSEYENRGERVILIHVDFADKRMAEDVDELKELAISAGASIMTVLTSARRAPDSKYFIGSGKIEELSEAVAAYQAELIIFNHALTPAQERNIEKATKCRVIDRTGLILDIFAQRARSFEGKLQVELATLKHQSTRLVRGWTHLERQRGGIGLRGGPGETQLEVDRRLLRAKIKRVTERLDSIAKQRAQSRQARKKAIIPTVALVGYTNAGKSTLFNLLTGSAVYVADQLFATLDPTLRRVDLPAIGPVIFADTVGFIRHLPHALIMAFHATLEEVIQADLLLHIVDIHDENKKTHIEQVDQVLTAIGADTVPRLLVYNKIDLCEPYQMPENNIQRNEEGKLERVFVSAVKQLGLSDLAAAIGEYLNKNIVEKELILLPEEGKLRADLYAKNAVLAEKIDDQGRCHLLVRLPKVELERFFR